MIDLNDFLLDGYVAVTYRNGLKTTGLVKLNATKNDATKADYPFIFVPSDPSFATLSYTVRGHYVVGKEKDWDIVRITYTQNVQTEQEHNPYLQSVGLVLIPAVVGYLSQDPEFQSLLCSQIERAVYSLLPNTFQDQAVRDIAAIVQSKVVLAID